MSEGIVSLIYIYNSIEKSKTNVLQTFIVNLTITNNLNTIITQYKMDTTDKCLYEKYLHACAR